MTLMLTFDDGPDPVWTPKLLDVLARAGDLFPDHLSRGGPARADRTNASRGPPDRLALPPARPPLDALGRVGARGDLAGAGAARERRCPAGVVAHAVRRDRRL